MAKTKRKKGVNPRAKGRRGEIEVRDELASWTGLKFQRCPQSGAFGSINKINNLVGDVYTEDPRFPWSVEVKNVETISIEGLLKDAKTPLFKFWDQTTTQADKAKKFPLLIFTKARAPLYFMMLKNTVPEDFEGAFFEYQSSYAYGIGRDMCVIVGLLKDLTKCSYPAFIMKLVND